MPCTGLDIGSGGNCATAGYGRDSLRQGVVREFIPAKLENAVKVEIHPHRRIKQDGTGGVPVGDDLKIIIRSGTV